MKTVRAVVTVAMVALILAAGWLPWAERAQAAEDLEMLLRLQYQAVNRGDVEAVVAGFTADAVLIRGACRDLLPCRGTEQIRNQAETERRNSVSYGLLSSQVSGNTVLARAAHWNVNVAAAGARQAIYTVTATFVGDKISRWVQELDITDADSAIFGNFDRVNGILVAENSAVQRGDVTAAAAFFTDDAMVDGLGLCRSSPCLGKAAVQAELQRQAADHTASTAVPGTNRITGSVRTQVAEIRSDSLRAAGVERIRVRSTAELRDDRIVTIRHELDASDPQTATYLAQVGVTAVQAPIQLPRTGSGGLKREEAEAAKLPLLIAGAVSLLVGGALCVRRRRSFRNGMGGTGQDAGLRT
jgi:ketosteroid isomerase-like protein